jgi:hypothetical protein
MRNEADELRKIVSDEDIAKSFTNTVFGNVDHRDIVKYSLLKYASVYSSGRTATCILKELGLLGKNNTLTRKGKIYLFEAFYNGNSI